MRIREFYHIGWGSLQELLTVESCKRASSDGHTTIGQYLHVAMATGPFFLSKL